MGLNLKLSILGIGIGSGTLISGVFGACMMMLGRRRVAADVRTRRPRFPVVFSVCAGMNLASGLETAPFVFWGVAGLSAALIGVFYRAYGHYARMTSPSGRHMSRVSTFLATTDADRIPSAPARSPKSPRLLRFLDWFLGLRKGFTATANPVGEPGLDDLRLTVPSTIAAGADPVRLTRVQFRALYSASIGRAISDDELDLIFSIFDADNDGHLSIDVRPASDCASATGKRTRAREKKQQGERMSREVNGRLPFANSRHPSSAGGAGCGGEREPGIPRRHKGAVLVRCRQWNGTGTPRSVRYVVQMAF